MTTHEFNNDTNQHTRREVLRNDSYFSRLSNNVDDAGGRYAKLTPSNVIGSTPSPTYPQLPSGPWAGDDPVPNEEPFGMDINVMEVNGTPTEIEKSLAALEEPALSPTTVVTPPAEVEDHAAEPVGITPLVPAGSSPTSIKRRF